VDQSLQEWVGRTETRHDEVTPWPIAALSATLDRDDPQPRAGDAVPPLWHWLYFLPVDRQSELGRDGHPQRGGFLPPVDLPRRMWAGGRLEFHDPLRIGDAITRVSRITDIREKEGRSGRLVFVVVRHQVSSQRGAALTEEHDIVYRGPAPGSSLGSRGGAEAPRVLTHTFQRTIHPDDVLLFRYSALTFNGHRIHYDRRYAMQQEGYPGLVVHGPLIATLLLDLVRRKVPEAEITKFSFRAVSPLFDTAPFNVCGRPEGNEISLWGTGPGEAVAMTASASTRP
jgi:3-methylfumaryl-CoA hydratase